MNISRWSLAVPDLVGMRVMGSRRGLRRALAVALVSAACAPGDRDGAADAESRGQALAATASSVRARQATPYTPRTLEVVGQLRGTIELEGPPPPDSVIRPTVDPLVCGTGHTRRGIEQRRGLASGVVVWIDGLRSGKPLPLERRFEITSDRCVLVPEVQTAIAGGTLNVRSLDAVEHRTRIAQRDGGEVLATIRETDEGQVVPNERVLALPGILELTCDVHAWTHAWIAVFDHPYFATTGGDGSFSIDSLPPGRYQLRGWHPRLGAIADSVTVTAGGVAQVALQVRAR